MRPAATTSTRSTPRRLIPTANVSNTPDLHRRAGQLDCTHAGGLTAPPAELYYQVVGVCADGFSEGPLSIRSRSVTRPLPPSPGARRS